MPRKRSVETAAIRRKGNSAGARVERRMATPRLAMSTSTSTTRNSFTSIQNPRRMSGNDVRKASAEKNVSWTTGQPERVVSSSKPPPMTMTVETAAIAVLR